MKKLFYGMVLCLLILLFAAGCDKSIVNNDNSNLKWGLQINGISIPVPCKLSDLEKTNIKIEKNNKREILNSTNEILYMVPATYEQNIIFLKVITGNNPEKKEDNATVTSIANNNSMSSDYFKLKNNIGIGSTVDDVIATFGNDFVVTTSQSNDLHDGFVITYYGTEENQLLIWYRDGLVEYIEISTR